jgi:GNAT superfamily N-acetyltransferase
MINEEYTFSTDKSKLDFEVIHKYLSQESYWAKGISREILKRSIDNSMCFGVYKDNEQVGFARIISDKATFAYLADVFVLSEHRGKGLSKILLEHIVDHPELQGLRRWLLGTADAHGLYARYGFKPLAKPDRTMEKYDPDIYKR